jgi:uncharacterized membrane protein YgaE (UPF0421/DUF939 family)
VNRIVPRSGLQLAVRASVAAALSLAIAQALELRHPLYAAIAAVIVTDLSRSATRRLGLHRLAATVVGAACGAILSLVLQPEAWAVGLGILLAMLACHLVRVPEGAKVSGYISGIVVFAHAAEPWAYAFFRFMETALGVGVAWAISYIPKLLPTEEPEDRPS